MIPHLATRTAADAQTRASVARSHVGRVRLINEDRVLDCPTASLWAVADGMGGHSGGDLAAQTVVDRLRVLGGVGVIPSLTSVLVALAQANAEIRSRNEAAGTDGGTTVVVATIHGEQAYIAWAGDSRAYRMRSGRLDLLTHDHSVVQELVDAGLLTSEQARHHPRANVITRALGVDEHVECQTLAITLEPGDRLLLCSDGLSRSLATDVTWSGPDTEVVDAMLAAALTEDGTDNISLVLVGASETDHHRERHL